MHTAKYQESLDYIESYWSHITFSIKKETRTHFPLPNKFVSPNAHVFKQDQFYWDSYFTILGLVRSKRVKLAKGMVDNFVYMWKKYGVIPSRNRYINLGISQPPFLTSMMLAVYEHDQDKKWLRATAKVCEEELSEYWMYNGKDKAEIRNVYEGLSRYADHNIVHATAEHESGWDMTSRFNEECLNILPVDLNALLYKYEVDLAYVWSELRNKKKSESFKRMARKRKKMMNELMWNEKKGFFYDYDFFQKKQMTFDSLAGFYPMWAGMVTDEQAKRMVKKMKRFEEKGGLANTQSTGLSKQFKQWDHPNGWAGQQWIVNAGLMQYGYQEDAERVAKKWLDMCDRLYKKTGKFWEKYDVVRGNVGKEARYPNQHGFGWTNAVFVCFVDTHTEV